MVFNDMNDLLILSILSLSITLASIDHDLIGELHSEGSFLVTLMYHLYPNLSTSLLTHPYL